MTISKCVKNVENGKPFKNKATPKKKWRQHYPTYENQLKNEKIRNKVLLKCLLVNRFQFLTTNTTTMNFKYYINSPRELCATLVKKCLFFLSDEMYLKIMYYVRMSQKLDLENPTRFTEKLQWLKLNYRRTIFHDMVDKIESKRLVETMLGKELIIPNLGIWSNFDDINFDMLPNQFVLKTSNGGGSTGVVIVKDKAKLNKDFAKHRLEASKKSNIYKTLREWPYSGIKGRIFAETYMQDESGELRDYKFYCFNGEVKVLLVASNRFSDHNFNYYDRNFNPMPIVSNCGKQLMGTLQKPEKLDQMIEVAEKLSNGLPHIRIDLYYVNGKIYFGEFTFFDASGYDDMSSKEWDLKFGDWLKLPEKIIES